MLINYHGESKVIKKICDILNGFKVSDISDVELTDLADGEVLKYDSATDKWINGTGGGGSSMFTVVDGKICVIYDDGQ